MIQVTCMCHNSTNSIRKTLKTWEQYADRFYILINDGHNGDDSQMNQTINQIKDLKNMNIIISKFKGFDITRNELLDASRHPDYATIMIDDSFELRYAPKKTIITKPQELFITCEKVSYYSVRILPANSTIKYINKIHETLDTNERNPSGILVEDVIYQDHKLRRYKRQEYDLSMLSDTPRDLYYKACTLINMYSINKVSRDKPIRALLDRLSIDGDPQETKLCEMYLIEILKINDN